jgi:hypothetical protein
MTDRKGTPKVHDPQQGSGKSLRQWALENSPLYLDAAREEGNG